MSAPTNAPDDQRRFVRYHPALDGLRALAIALVVLFHYPWHESFFDRNPVHGGFLGVDVFFVLSGFLITSLLLDEFRTSGGISMRSFYARRALRLLPGFVVLFAIAVVAHFAFVKPSARPTTAGLLGMAFYAANWVQIWFRDPLGRMFGHTWSLAIEEQFYLVFPLVVLGLLRRGVQRGRLLTLFVAGAAVSAVWRIHLWDRPPVPSSLVDFYAMVTGRTLPASNPFQQWNRWYFGTDTRLDSLLIGAAAAVVLTVVGPAVLERVRRMAPVVVVAALVGLGVIVANGTILDSWIPYWGLVVLELLVAAAVIGVVVRPDSLPARLLSLPVLVWLGRRSYAIYLFHQVVFYELGGGRVNIPQPWQFIVMISVVLLVAEFSWRVIEQPFLRRKARFQRITEVVA